jgi:D-isomer specific 2-hydroxyacid dehydrogenase, catalytic domain
VDWMWNMTSELSQVHNEGGKWRVLVTKNLPGKRWLDVLVSAGCRVEVCTSTQTILDVPTIQKLVGDKCDGVIGQLTEDWGDTLFSTLKKAGGRAYSNYAVGYNNVNVKAATENGIPVGNTPGECACEMPVRMLVTDNCAIALFHSSPAQDCTCRCADRDNSRAGGGTDISCGAARR